MERDQAKTGIGVTIGIIMALLLMVTAISSYTLGQEAVITSCEKTSFFYVHTKVYECMLVRKELGK